MHLGDFVKKNKKYIILLAIALVMAIFLEISLFVIEKEPKSNSEGISLIGNPEFAVGCLGYNINGNHYASNSADPQIIVTNINRQIKTIVISFSSSSLGSNDIQVFYSTNGAFSEASSVSLKKSFGQSNVVIDVPEDTYSDLRLDIDGSFYLDSISIYDQQARLSTVFANDFNLLQIVIMFIFIAFALGVLLWWLTTKKTERSLTHFELLFLIACFVFYFLWAVSKQFNYGPDEAMRYDVTWFLFQNNRLPVGSELSSAWGFSYAHSPTVLCNILGYLIMKVVSVFSMNEFILLISARMVGVICATVTIYFVIKASKLVFKTSARWVMIVFIAFMPQFAFLASYTNNDMVAMMGVSIIFYVWALATKENWSVKALILLSVGMSICALAYFNSYSWILFSAVFFIFTYFMKNPKDYKGFAKLASVAVVLTLLLISYTFIRHLVLYGDLLGFKTSEYYGELLAIESLKPSARLTLAEQGIPFSTMLFDPPYNWIKSTFASSVGIFGYMQFTCPNIIYVIVASIIIVTLIAFLIKVIFLVIKKEKIDKIKLSFYIAVALSGIVTVCLSLYYSYFSDFQPQGRYCYPAMIALAFFVAKGFEFLMNLLPRKEYKCAAVCSFCVSFILISVLMFNVIYLPS